jgi:hypothetical protein
MTQLATVETQSIVPSRAASRGDLHGAEGLRSSDLMAVLAEIESRFAVADWRVAGIALWPLLRLRWFFAEWSRHYATSGFRVRTSERVWSMMRGALASLHAHHDEHPSDDYASRGQDLVFLSDGLSFAKLGDRWIERFCDPLIAAAARQGATSALWTPLHVYHRPRRTRSTFVQPAVDVANVVGAARARLSRVDAHLPDHAAMVDFLAAAGFGTATLSASKIVSDSCRVRSVRASYARRLARVKPRLAFVVSYYSLEGMAFTLACRDAGALVVDIQHGVQGPVHPAYAAWPRPPAGGSHEMLPDLFWVWSEAERDVIERWAAGTKHSAIVGDNPWLDVWRSGYEWPGVRAAVSAAEALRRRSAGRPTVLVTLQFGLDDREQLDPLRELIAEAGNRFTFWVRLHPVMLSERETVRAKLGGAGDYELDVPSDLPLHALIPLIDAHLTHSSSTAIEAAQFGVPSVITTSYGAELLDALLASGIAVRESGPAPLVAAALNRLIATQRSRSTPLHARRSEQALAELLASRPAAADARRRA